MSAVTFNHKHLRSLFKVLVCGACIYYLVRAASHLDASQLRLIFLPAAFGAGLLYFFCTLLMAQAWRLILLSFHPENLSFETTAVIYFRSALAKYIPSNMMHYAARHYMCGALGISHKAVLASNLIEISVVLAAALSLLAGFVLIEPKLLPESIAAHQLFFRVGAVILGVALLATLVVIVRHKTKGLHVEAFSVRGIAAAYMLDIVFLPLTGLVLYALLWALQANLVLDGPMVGRIVFAYICAWTLGFVTPGAPGGLGVREAAMTAILGPVLGSDIALLGALLFRFSTLLGEVLGYGFALYLERRRPAPSRLSIDKTR